MNVSHEKVLQKMEQEIAAARNAGPGGMERHIYVIKSMCDLLIGAGVDMPAPVQAATPAVMMPPAQPPVQVAGQKERIATEDGSNGDSIFDF
ncbi:YwdI family protein [Domibacillus robiginosus]|uniref:YwdI family protein n=1 Tax=Domibacillus robiginosus TaxID=1071054 RepID=UPI00067B7FED|nr:YwdI family protein [Domibacillus robiginosus]